jgi:hypothetical protein
MAADVTVGLTTGHRSSGAGQAAPAGGATAPAQAGAAGAGPAATPAAAPAADAAEKVAESAPVMPGLSASDRAAIASATGYYITASGKVTPEGMPPWGFIARYVEQRQAERAPEVGDHPLPTNGAAPNDGVDVTV